MIRRSTSLLLGLCGRRRARGGGRRRLRAELIVALVRAALIVVAARQARVEVRRRLLGALVPRAREERFALVVGAQAALAVGVVLARDAAEIAARRLLRILLLAVLVRLAALEPVLREAEALAPYVRGE